MRWRQLEKKNLDSGYASISQQAGRVQQIFHHSEQRVNYSSTHSTVLRTGIVRVWNPEVKYIAPVLTTGRSARERQK